MNLKKFFSLTILALAVLMMFTACEKEDIAADGTPEQVNQQNGVIPGGSLGFVAAENGNETGELPTEFEECFTINYPITINFPDGTSEVINDDDALETVIDNWFENQPEEVEDFPTIVYPVDVTLPDGTVQTIADDEALCDLLFECFDYDDDYDDEYDDDYDEDDFEYLVECFTPVFPFDIMTEAGTTVTINDLDALETLFADQEEDWEVVFPVDVTLTEDGSIVTVTDDDQLEELLYDCFGDDYYDDDYDDCPEDFEGFEDCVTPVYPISVTVNGFLISSNSEEELFTLFDGLAYEDEVEIVYPIELILAADETTVTANNDEELEAILEDCE